MVNQYLVPFFLNEERVIFSESLKFMGIGESSLETELIDLIDNQSNPTIAPLAGQHEVSLRITANANTKQQAIDLIQPVKTEILNRIGEFYYGSDDLTVEDAVFNELDQPLVIYDGITDGVLNARLKLSKDSKQYLKSYLLQNSWTDEMMNISQDDSIEQIANKLKSTFNVESVIVLKQDHKESTVYISHMQKRKNLFRH